MIPRILKTLFWVLLLVGCQTKLSILEEASESYKRDKDYASLEYIYHSLNKGMPQKNVVELLGTPDYSPIDGQDYYSSDHMTFSKELAREVGIGLVVDYRSKNGALSGLLQEFWLGSIGE